MACTKHYTMIVTTLVYNIAYWSYITDIDAAGTSGVGSVPDAGQSSEAEANKAKRSRAEFEADDNMTAPSTKRQRVCL